MCKRCASFKQIVLIWYVWLILLVIGQTGQLLQFEIKFGGFEQLKVFGVTWEMYSVHTKRLPAPKALFKVCVDKISSHRRKKVSTGQILMNLILI